MQFTYFVHIFVLYLCAQFANWHLCHYVYLILVFNISVWNVNCGNGIAKISCLLLTSLSRKISTYISFRTAKIQGQELYVALICNYFSGNLQLIVEFYSQRFLDVRYNKLLPKIFYHKDN